MSTTSIVILLMVLAALAWAVFAFNRLVRLRNQVRTAWADIDVQLMRRHDLVPPLVAAVRAYAAHESAVLQAVTELRTRALGLNGPAQLAAVESDLEQALARLLALKEAHPDLKANANFAQLQRDLVAIEEHLQYARRFYNGAVRDYNDTVQRVPDLLIARAVGHAAAEFFETGPGQQRTAPAVELQP